MVDENNEKPKEEDKKFAGLGGEPGEDETSTPEQAPEMEISVWDLTELEQIVADDGKNVWVDEAGVVSAYQAKTKSGKEVIMYILENGFYFEAAGKLPEKVSDSAYDIVKRNVENYQTKVNAVIADRKKKAEDTKTPVPPAETPQDDDSAFEELPMDAETIDDKMDGSAPLPAPVAGNPAYVKVMDVQGRGYMVQAKLPGDTVITYQMDGFFAFSGKIVGTDGKPIAVPKEYVSALKQIWSDHKKDYLALKGIKD